MYEIEEDSENKRERTIECRIFREIALIFVRNPLTSN